MRRGGVDAEVAVRGRHEGGGRAPRPSISLSRDECFEHLHKTRIGHLGISLGALPVIRPIPFVTLGESVLFPVPELSDLHRASSGRVVAFEADGFDAASALHWYVLIQGIPIEVDPLDLSIPALAPSERAVLETPGSRLLLLPTDVVSGALVDTSQ